MRIALTARNSTALLALSLLMQETHELAHTTVGRLICGCWGKRDFNVWSLCRDCKSEAPLTVLATFAGPVYSFAVIWLGYVLLTRASAGAKSMGLALVVSSMPFSRVLTPMFGAGDEIFGLRELGVDRSLAWAATLVVVFGLAVPPVVKIWSQIESPRRLMWVIGLMLAPFVLVGAIVFGVLQGLILKNGILADPWIMGSPTIVTLWELVLAGLLVLFGRHLVTLVKADRK